jgi:hypothetical protein
VAPVPGLGDIERHGVLVRAFPRRDEATRTLESGPEVANEKTEEERVGALHQLDSEVVQLLSQLGGQRASDGNDYSMLSCHVSVCTGTERRSPIG